MTEKFKLSQEHIEKIERMINNVISTGGGSDDMELKIIDNAECEAFLTAGIEAYWK